MPGFGLIPGRQDQIAGPTRIAETIHIGVQSHHQRILRALDNAFPAIFRTGRPYTTVILRPQHVFIAFRLNVNTIGTNLGTPPAGNAGGESVNPVFAHGVPVAVWSGKNLPLHVLLRPVTMSRLRLDLFNLNFCDSCCHAITCAKNEAVCFMPLQGSRIGNSRAWCRFVPSYSVALIQEEQSCNGS
jgi:hypothetical protein